MRRALWIALALTVPGLRQGAAQGMLPGAPAPSTSTPTALMIGESVPDAITIHDNGVARALVSYKTALDVLVVGFLSARCPAQDAERPRLRRFYQKYRDWRVAFVAVNEGPAAAIDDLAASLKRDGMAVPVVQDPGHAAAATLQVRAVPVFLIIDESGVLRYRGSLDHAARALDAVIGHTEPVPAAEPALAQGCAL